MKNKSLEKKINYLIVKHLFKLPISFKTQYGEIVYFVDKKDCDEKTFFNVNNIHLTDMGHMMSLVEVNSFSNDLDASFIVVDELRKKDNCCIKLDLDVPGNIWTVTIKGNNFNCEKKGLGSNESLPMAICYAALLSLGLSRDDIDRTML